MRKWRLVTDCPTHGRQRSVVVTFRAQKPREVAACPPVCPRCEHIDEPQARIVSIEAVPRERAAS